MAGVQHEPNAAVRVWLALFCLTATLGGSFVYCQAPPGPQLPVDPQAPAPGQEMPGQEMVAELRITGNQHYTVDRIVRYIHTRANRPYNPELVQEDVRRLSNSRMFLHVNASTQDAPGGKIVIIEVSEKPTLQYVQYVGCESIKKKVLAKEVKLKAGDALDPYAVTEARRTIEEFYHSKGFGKVYVTVFEGDKEGDKGAVFVINEGQKERVLWAQFRGNAFASEGQLRTKIKAKPAFLWFFGTLDRKEIEEDKNRLTAYYRSMGFFQAKVGAEPAFNEQRNWLTITYVIDEGPRSKVRNVSVLGNQKIPTDDLSTETKLKAGDYYSQPQLIADVTRMTDMYGAIGYVFAKVDPDVRFLEEPGQIDLIYNIKEGNRYRVGRIDPVIKGENPHTKLTTVFNRLSIYPGQVVDTREIRASERRMKSSQLYENNPMTGSTPKITMKRPGGDEGETEMAERPTRRGYRGQSPDPVEPGGDWSSREWDPPVYVEEPEYVPVDSRYLPPPDATRYVSEEPFAAPPVQAPYAPAEPQYPVEPAYGPLPEMRETAPQIERRPLPEEMIIRGQSPDAPAPPMRRTSNTQLRWGSWGSSPASSAPPIVRTAFNAPVDDGSYGSAASPLPQYGNTTPQYGGSGAPGGFAQPMASPPPARPAPQYVRQQQDVYPGQSGTYDPNAGAAVPTLDTNPGPYRSGVAQGTAYPPASGGPGMPAPAYPNAPYDNQGYASPGGAANPGGFSNPNGFTGPGGLAPPPNGNGQGPEIIPGPGAPLGPGPGAPGPGGLNLQGPIYGTPFNGGGFPLSGPLNEEPLLPLDLTPQLTETMTGRLMLSVGVNSDAGLLGSVVVDEQNFDWTRFPRSWEEVLNGTAWRGNGERLRLEAMPGTQLQRYTASWTTPYLMDTRISETLSAFYFDRRYTEWTERRIGTRVAFGYQFLPDLWGTFSYRFENVRITNPILPPGFIPELDEAVGTSTLHGFRFQLTRDTRDNSFLPTEGYLLDMGFEEVTGSFTYPRADLDMRKYFLMRQHPDGSGRHVLSLNGRFAWSGSDTPIYERFYAGGFSTIRGFEFRGVTPRKFGVGVGGDFSLMASAEYLFPITADDTLKGVVFCDTGTVEPTISKWTDNYRVAPGFGLRITIPAMGPAPIALDFAFPVSEQPGDQRQVFSFFVGWMR